MPTSIVLASDYLATAAPAPGYVRVVSLDKSKYRVVGYRNRGAFSTGTFLLKLVLGQLRFLVACRSGKERGDNSSRVCRVG